MKIVRQGGVLVPMSIWMSMAVMTLMTAMTSVIFSGVESMAQTLEFDSVSKDDLKVIVREMSADLYHTSVSGAAPLGDMLGFEIGVIGGLTKTSGIQTLVKRQDPDANAEWLPHARLFGAVSVPMGVTLELGLIPETGVKDFKFQLYGGAVKWSLTHSLLSFLPLSLATKVHYTVSEVNYKQPVNNVETSVSMKNTVSGISAIVSKDFLVVEPYFGLGYLSAEGDVSVSGSSTLFDFTTATKSSSKPSSTLMMAGAELKFFIFKVGVEYSRQFETDRYSLKLAGFF